MRIKHKFENIISKYQSDNDISQNLRIDGNFKVWIFWWQGEESLPETNRITINSVIHNIPNNEVIILTKDNVKQYCNLLGTYLLIDCLLNIAYDEISYLKKMIDDVPVNNENVFLLEDKLNNVIDSNNGFDFLTKTTYLYKITYKNQHFQTSHNKKTIYGVLYDKYIK